MPAFNSIVLLGLLNEAQAIPFINDEALNSASSVLGAEDDSEPFGRILMAMAAVEKNLDENALFAMAGSHPNLVEMVLDKKMRTAIDYIITLPAKERHGIRKGETILRTVKQMGEKEKERALKLAKTMNLDEKGLSAIRIGSFNRLSITVQVHTVTGCWFTREETKKELNMAWPGTPARNKKSREFLTKKFNARPTVPAEGSRSQITVRAPSFESPTAMTEEWGTKTNDSPPVGTMEIDYEESIDGTRSLRFYSEAKTRSYPRLMQWLAVKEGQELVATFYTKTRKLRMDQIVTPDSYSDSNAAAEKEVEKTEEAEEEGTLYHAIDKTDGEWNGVVYNWDKTTRTISFTSPSGDLQVLEQNGEAGQHLIGMMEWKPGSKDQPKDVATPAPAVTADPFTPVSSKKVGLFFQFYDSDQHPIGSSYSKTPRTGTHKWEQHILNLEVPRGATALQATFKSEMSGTIWFDALTITVK